MDESFDFASMMESSQREGKSRTERRLRPGEVVEGKVVQIGRDSVFVDVGATVEARIDRGEFEDKKGTLNVTVGQSVRASVISASDVGGPVLSIALGRSGQRGLDVGQLENAKEAGLPVEGMVKEAVKAGVEVEVGGVRAFCPASQLDISFVSDLSQFVGQALMFNVLEVKDKGRSVVLSRRALLEKDRAQKTQAVLDELKVGGQYSGTVVTVQKYGAFVDLGGGVEGLVHISEISHSRIDRVEDVLSVGESVQVQLLALEPPEKGDLPRLRLSMKALQSAPERARPGATEILPGTVSKVGSFGVFVDTKIGTGLVPVRELGIPRGADFRKQFPIGRELRVVSISREDSSKLTFSIERVAGVEERQNYREFTEANRSDPAAAPASEEGTFGALLRQKLKLPEPPPSAPPRQQVPPAAVEAAQEELLPAAAVPAPPIPQRPKGPPPAGVVRRRR